MTYTIDWLRMLIQNYHVAPVLLLHVKKNFVFWLLHKCQNCGDNGENYVNGISD